MEWVCSNPALGHAITSWTREIENARTPAAADYVKNWCMECVFPLEKALDELTETSFVRGSVEAMSLFDRGTATGSVLSQLGVHRRAEGEAQSRE